MNRTRPSRRSRRSRRSRVKRSRVKRSRVKRSRVKRSRVKKSRVKKSRRSRATSFGFNGDTECTICTEDLGYENIGELSCRHSFHRNCINQWLIMSNTCPNCRRTVINVSIRRFEHIIKEFRNLSRYINPSHRFLHWFNPEEPENPHAFVYKVDDPNDPTQIYHIMFIYHENETGNYCKIGIRANGRIDTFYEDITNGINVNDIINNIDTRIDNLF